MTPTQNESLRFSAGVVEIRLETSGRFAANATTLFDNAGKALWSRAISLRHYRTARDFRKMKLRKGNCSVQHN
jgi:hypothetical protein